MSWLVNGLPFLVLGFALGLLHSRVRRLRWELEVTKGYLRKFARDVGEATGRKDLFY